MCLNSFPTQQVSWCPIDQHYLFTSIVRCKFDRSYCKSKTQEGLAKKLAVAKHEWYYVTKHEFIQTWSLFKHCILYRKNNIITKNFNNNICYLLRHSYCKVTRSKARQRVKNLCVTTSCALPCILSCLSWRRFYTKKNKNPFHYFIINMT